MKCISLTFIAFTALLALPQSTRAQTETPQAAPEAAPAQVAAEPPAQPPPPAAAPTQPAVRVVAASDASDAVVSMAFDETPLSDVIKAFRDATGANIISGGTNLHATISVSLDNVPWRQGLSSILDPHDLQLLEQPINSGIFVVTTKTVVIPRVTKTFILEYAKASDVADLFLTLIGKTGGAVTAFKETNALILTATEQQIAECEEILKAIDRPSPQVYIEVRFVELSAAASKKLGMKWDSLNGWTVSTKNISGGMEYSNSKIQKWLLGNEKTYDAEGKLLTSDPVYLVPEEYTGAPKAGLLAEDLTWRQARGIGGQMTAQDFSLTLSAFEKMDGVSIFSNPKIIVANEKEALVDMTTKEPNLTVTTSRTGTSGDQLDISAKLEAIPGDKGDKDGKGRGLFAGEVFFSYGLSLKVTPRISPTGLITLNVEPSISDKLNDYEFTGVDSSSTPTPKYPIIYMQRLQTVFTMQSGSTAVIGGLTKTKEENIDSGIPFLREIPWVGPRVFGWKSRGKSQSEIIIFVTVGVADPLTMKENVGLPKNAVLGRDILSGEMKEPGDRTKADLFDLDDKRIYLPSVNNPSPVATETEASLDN
ncbi:MAG: secretin N-terminal domain-containing protein [Kiritimatiellae bacterium]|nr:secretin N-terminal domain-containing protein [Kiritimatiellia bacterium]